MEAIRKKDRRILVVDDMPKNIKVIGTILRENDFLVSVAQSGKQAFDVVEQDPPDLILLDVMMPEMDGFEVCRRLKKNPLTKDIPVIFLTGLADPLNKLQGFNIGAVDYVTKPIETEELLARINTHLALSSLYKELEEINIKLEEKVSARTRELAEKNKDLIVSEERFRSLVETVSDWIWEMDRDFVYTYVSPKVRELLGYPSEQVVGKTPFDFMPKEEAGRMEHEFRDIVASERSFERLEYVNLDRDGQLIIFEASGIPITGTDGNLLGYRGVNRNITERKRLEEMMIQTEKMMSVGGLAAGMAHEIKNPLSGILQCSQVMQNRIKVDQPKNRLAAEECGTDMKTIESYMEHRGLKQMLDTIVETGIRASELVDNMLSFSRKGDETGFSFNSLGGLLDKIIEIARSDYDLKKKYDFRQIEIIREYDESMPDVPCEAGMIQQVFMNILKNGAEAMHTAKAEDQMPEEKKFRFILRITHDGSMARVEIEDNGPGIEETIRRRVFEPFFTTKDKAKGTGLGLSVSYFIVTDTHHGAISVESTPGKGTKFIIRLPLERITLVP